MRQSLEEMVAFAIKYQPFILELELQKGGTLTYRDEQGNYVSRYPDGHIEPADLSEPLREEDSCQGLILSEAEPVLTQSRSRQRACLQIYHAR